MINCAISPPRSDFLKLFHLEVYVSNVTTGNYCTYGTYVYTSRRLLNQSKKCFDRESNTGPSDLQSDALPTELSKHATVEGHWLTFVVYFELKRQTMRKMLLSGKQPAPTESRWTSISLLLSVSEAIPTIHTLY